MTVLSSISQTDCKGLRLINGDTINLYDSVTVQKLNKVFTDLDLADSLNKKYEKDIEDYIFHIAGLNGENRILGEKNALGTRIIKEKETQVEILETDNKKKDKKIKLLKKTRNLFGIVGVAIGGVITYYGQKLII